ncbi:MAG: peptidoglycan bridge formation glycyltransferase FemA/FemB family protein [Treponema sp.]|jgi:lipid II:glycine glycyltransferase (peptidoglycan interpeptide bridge formation enzyme)|nr:peptidoglycan bridge formation glycyltransferase FemA/FemB family protein [Treponema sp.]
MAQYVSRLVSVVPVELSLCNTAKSFLQSGFWGSFKARFGWNARGFLVDWGELGQTPLMVIRRRLFPGCSFAYIPWGPELPENFPAGDGERNRALVDLAVTLRHLLPEDTAFVRFDLPWLSTSAPLAIHKPLRRAGADIQPPDTVFIDLTADEDAILAGMKSKARYNIKLASKKGVVVKRVDEEGIPAFYSLLKTTAKRDGIAIHGVTYYETLFSHYKNYLDASGCPDTRPGSLELGLYLAEHEGDLLAGIVALFRGKDAVYLYGASADCKRNLMAPYLLQWTAMSYAKSRGCAVYDLFGIPPDEDPKRSMAGLYRFKTSFGGAVGHRPGSWDYAYKPVLRTLFVAAETARRKARSLRRSKKSGRSKSL